MFFTWTSLAPPPLFLRLFPREFDCFDCDGADPLGLGTAKGTGSGVDIDLDNTDPYYYGSVRDRTSYYRSRKPIIMSMSSLLMIAVLFSFCLHLINASNASQLVPPSWPPAMPPILPMAFFATVTGFQTGEAGNVVFFNESTSGKNVSLEGVWHYDFSTNRMRADYAESVDGVFMRDLTEYWVGNGLPGNQGEMVTIARPFPV